MDNQTNGDNKNNLAINKFLYARSPSKIERGYHEMTVEFLNQIKKLLY